jgi:uncharacterized protein DUF4154
MAFLNRTASWLVLSTIVVCTTVALSALPQSPSATEANIKAVFLFNFAKYVTWPAQAAGERSPAGIRICVTFNDSFFALLKEAVEEEDVDGKPLEPIALDGLDDARSCQILFVGDANSPDGKAWLNAVKGRQVLTVGDGPLNDETVIAFVRDDNRVRFDINRAAAASHGLNVSSKLLRLARQVRER